MKGTPTALIIVVLTGAAAAYYVAQSQEGPQVRDLVEKVIAAKAELTVVKAELSETRKSLLGYTKYTDYLSEGRKAIEGQMKFLAAQVNRDYVQVRHIEDSTLGIKTGATVILNYAVEYSFGFDLAPKRFRVDKDADGLLVTLPKPDLIATPAVKIQSHEIPSWSLMIDEKAVVIALQQGLTALAQQSARKLKEDPAVIALCEKKLGEFLRDFLAKQPGVTAVPTIRFQYI